jgi:(E)-4-hydroxy-3-methylbut-2-enyl-diphosphate synthase
MSYCPSIYQSVRFKTREVPVGKILVGGNQPIRIQSMTTSSTHDIEATIDQIMRLADTGCEIARVTVQGMREADACEGIKNGLLKRGYEIPLVADIHFYPPAAMRVVDFVDKVRINPGNFVDKRATFKVIEYDDKTYQEEIDKIEEKFTPLVEKCKKLKRSMRIGTNHGSLSDRIMNRYGDTPFGMVESAFEFTRVCRKLGYHDIIYSMKASNPLVMIQAYRLLVAEMMKLGWDYPIHLGVTEAGGQEDGRVKSACGIGALLLDGIGDTIRVSLTEDPWEEIDPCKRLVRFANEHLGCGIAPFEETTRDFINFSRREILLPESGLHRDGSVILETKANAKADNFLIDSRLKGMGEVQSLAEAKEGAAVFVGDGETDLWPRLLTIKPSVILLQLCLHSARKFFEYLKKENIKAPVILAFDYTCSEEDLIIQASAECGALLCDGLGDGVCIRAPHIDPNKISSLSFSLLQAVRMRRTKTDFISCPGCGRTLFNLQEVTEKIRSRTLHLPGVSIAIMGCIVNGPGEMADADFGYVGSKSGMVDLYVGKTCVERSIDQAIACDRLIELIKAQGRWVEPEEVAHETVTV